MQSLKLPCLIGGEPIYSADTYIKDINPADANEIIAEFPMLGKDELLRAFESAEEAQERWAAIPAPERGKILIKTAYFLENQFEELARILTKEEGKTINESSAEVARAISIFKFYGVMGYRLRGEFVESADQNTYIFTVREPLGVVSIITPWNFPIAIPVWKIAPALVCGNTVVFKPASYTPLIAFKVTEALHKAGLPPGVLNFVTGSGSLIGDIMVNNSTVDAISFTGSLEVGNRIAQLAAARKTVRVQLELGGKNAAVILDDADLDLAVAMVTRAAFGLTGQACTATSRAIIHERVFEEFTRKLVERVRRIRVGNGLEENVEMGPVVGEKELNKILDYIKLGISEGAKLVYGGNRLTTGNLSNGYFMEPTIFSEVEPDMRIAQEEIFGPVLALMRVRSFDEAVEIANQVDYGLAASIYTRDLKKAFEFIKNIQAGVVKINKPTTGVELHVPFGGYKHSSYGMVKEQGETALDFYTKMKTVYLSY